MLDVGRCPSIPGGVAERLIAPVLKTGRPKGLVSSNLTPSATLIIRQKIQPHHLFQPKQKKRG
jgi:hypothetical protein